MEMKEKLSILACPECKSEVDIASDHLTCKRCGKKSVIEDGIIMMHPNMEKEKEISRDKWDDIYKKELKEDAYHKEYENYEKTYFEDTYRQLDQAKKIDDIIYLEIGCGPFFLGQKIADKCNMIIGIDFSLNALRIAKKMLDEKGIKNYLLIQGDINNMPLKNLTIDLIYGGGVIEHFKETQKCINELYRVLKNDGISFNTVPYLNIGALTYKQIWGNIPNFPILKQCAHLIHIYLLKSRHMTFGYELSFLKTTLKKIHKTSGFSKIDINKFDVEIALDFITPAARKPLIWLAQNCRLFWPMIKVIAQK